MKILLLLCTILPVVSLGQWSGNTTPTYPELIAYYQKLDREHPEIELYAMGQSDTDWPIYVCIVNGAQDSLKTFEKARKSSTVLINNAIHPGEPDGVNACLIWLDNWIRSGKKTSGLPVVAIIPAYNVGGMFNRSSNSRANQDGPEEYGFRGNSQNLDLNRDFIKMDSRNAFTFATIYQALDPDVFVDTHVSNGADYQYTLTYISSMKERLAPSLREITYNKCIPDLTARLKKRETDLFPYVELKEDIPEKGIVAFNDLPRYAMGYATLFHAISFTVETHMLKPFPQRVEATKQFIEELIRWTGECAPEIELARSSARKWSNEQRYFHFGYELTDKIDSVSFNGFQPVYKLSPVTGLKRLFYDRTQPFTKKVPYFGTYEFSDSIRIPEYYVLSGACQDVIDRLRVNGVVMYKTRSDTVMTAETLSMGEFQTVQRPYEGHYQHYKGKTVVETEKVHILSGSWIIPAKQERSVFVLSVLEPMAEDSYFAWNFFDSYLQQKEYFSPYVFEEKALELLKNDPRLAADFSTRKETDKAFAGNSWDQLYFIYKRSPYFEKGTFNRLPVFKLYDSVLPGN